MKSHVSSSHLVHPLPFLPLSFLCLSFSIVLSLSLSLSLRVRSCFLPCTSAGGARATGNKERLAEKRGDARGDREKEKVKRFMGWREKWCRRKSAEAGWEHAKWSPKRNGWALRQEREDGRRTGAKVKIRPGNCWWTMERLESKAWLKSKMAIIQSLRDLFDPRLIYWFRDFYFWRIAYNALP